MTLKKYTKSGWQEEQRKKTLKALEELIKRIRSGDLEVINFGSWSSGMGSVAFRVDLKEKNS